MDGLPTLWWKKVYSPKVVNRSDTEAEILALIEAAIEICSWGAGFINIHLYPDQGIHPADDSMEMVSVCRKYVFKEIPVIPSEPNTDMSIHSHCPCLKL